jgi:poly-gamma-glutamate synthesis protein (capsule biosynthesis protein)
VLALLVTLGAVGACSSGAPPARPPGAPAVSPAGVSPVAPTVQTATSAEGATATGEPPSFTLLAAGDVLAHDAVIARARADAGGSGYDFRPMLAAVAPRIAAAGLAICHVETPLSASDARLSGYPVFNSPRELATAFAAAGFDGCSTASNHSLDQGLAGIAATLDVLDAAGLGHAGTARSATERRRTQTHDVHGVRVAHLSYTYGTNGTPVPPRAGWSVNLISVPVILADARAARAAGAAFVVVSMHWGTEYQVEPTGEEQKQARELLASPDVDLILGDHVHVQQPVRRIVGKYVVYGLGNLLSNQSPAAGLRPETEDGSLITVHLRGVRTAGGTGVRYQADEVTYTPTFCPIGSYRVLPVVAALADRSTPAALRAPLEASLARTRAIQSAGVATLDG